MIKILNEYSSIRPRNFSLEWEYLTEANTFIPGDFPIFRIFFLAIHRQNLCVKINPDFVISLTSHHDSDE